MREVIARVEQLCQESPDDYRLRSRTKIFQSTATIDEIFQWAQTIAPYRINDISITEAE